MGSVLSILQPDQNYFCSLVIQEDLIKLMGSPLKRTGTPKESLEKQQ